MDDTNWISDSEQNIASILTISKEFFSFTNILVNDFKAELMTTAKLIMITNSNGVSPITFTTGLSTVTLTPKLHRSSVRYLGVWINLNKSRTFVLNQCKREISVCCSLLRSKRASDKQLLYVYNMVIIPHLEYLTQITILTAKECRQII